jgi:predicted alpha/beta-hydrolase family hydrolase
MLDRMNSARVVISVAGAEPVSGLWQAPPDARACLVFAHGAGAGMAHKWMTAVADGLAARQIATLRYQFSYMERAAKRVDPPKVAHAAVRAAVAEARERWGSRPLFAGGKSFGGRMTSQAQAVEPLEGVQGLVFFGFPLHPAGTPSTDRATHLGSVAIPMLFLQGTRDALADLDLLRAVVVKLGRRATLKLFTDADHSFHVPARSGRKDSEVLKDLLDSAAIWMTEGSLQGVLSE